MAIDRLKVQKKIRALHRDIGFFLVGMTVLYCISGMILLFGIPNRFKIETRITKTIEPYASNEQISKALNLKKINISEETDEYIRFGKSSYAKRTGEIEHYVIRLPSLLTKLNRLHRERKDSVVKYFTGSYAVLLAFLALSSFFIYKRGSKLFYRGLIISILGIAASLALLFGF